MSDVRADTRGRPVLHDRGSGTTLLALAIGRAGRRLAILSTLLLAAIGWGYLILAVATGGHALDAGFGMPALAPLLNRLGGAFPVLTLAETGESALMPPMMSAWSGFDAVVVFAMWVAMVFAMMIPTAAPTFNAYAVRGRRTVGGVMAGYTAVWLAIAVVGAAAQVAMTRIGALSPMMAPAGIALSTSILLAAGVYQFTPLKLACLVRCRAPRVPEAEVPRFAEAFRLGVEEGLACVGCCWAMMAVMFAAGMMNLFAMAAFGVLMGLEKVASGLLLSRLIGGLLIASGLALASARFIG